MKKFGAKVRRGLLLLPVGGAACGLTNPTSAAHHVPDDRGEIYQPPLTMRVGVSRLKLSTLGRRMSPWSIYTLPCLVLSPEQPTQLPAQKPTALGVSDQFPEQPQVGHGLNRADLED